MKRYLGLAAVAAAMLFCGGCGYRIGSLVHPQLKTVAVAPVQNETLEYNLTAQVRNLLCERFMTDGSLKLVDEKEADCIVYARIVDAKYAEVSWAESTRAEDGEDILLPNEWSVTLVIEYTVIIPGRVQPLVSARRVSGTANFQTGPDQLTGRMNGVRQAAYAAAKQVVASFTEGW
ncbi:LPS assembly lipoprotein LptE [uncultured Victivallis sp.]|uniref:LPS assembly lipoprotein LptE n=1 Tax=uncultured Victivallis sp. TaxID=354118 RepID=UPI0025DADB27|nr:LPS assembly lipoprotein LptE [uncultured Victivallis sp.]